MVGRSFSPGMQPPAYEPEDAEARTTIPACSVCGRQDETLRLVVFPFVISVILITFRRAFVGLWCRRHRNIKLLQAGGLSAFLGWFGFPYGLFYTPAALWKLARGGDQPLDSNTQMLKALAEHKLKQGDVQGAARCLEASLQVDSEDDDAVGRLGEIYRKYPYSISVEPASTLLLTLVLILAGISIGGLLGFIDFLTTRFFGLFTTLDFVGAILSWIPVVGAVSLSGVLLAHGIEWIYTRMQLRQKVFGAVVAVMTAVVAAYGIAQGRTLAEFLEAFLTGGAVAFDANAIMMLGALLTRGGAWLIGDTIQSGETSGVIYLIILAAALVFYASSNLTSSSRITAWQEKLHALRPQPVSDRAPAFLQGWIAVFAFPFAMILLGVAFADVAPLTRVGPSMAKFMSEGEELFDLGDLEGAARAFEQAAELDPTDAWSRTTLGWTYYWQGRFEDARDAFQEAVLLAPEIMEAHLGLGFSLSPLGEYSLALQHFEIVLEGAADPILLAQAYYGLADVYAQMETYDLAVEMIHKAIELEPENANLHMNLGWYRIFQEQYDAALESFDLALELQPGLVEALFGVGYAYFGLGDFEQARNIYLSILDMDVSEEWLVTAKLSVGRTSYFAGEFAQACPYYEEALAQNPGDPYAWIELTLMYIWQGEFDTALERAQTLVDLQPDLPAGYALQALVYHFKDQKSLMQTMQDKALELLENDEEAIYLFYYLLTYSHQFDLAASLLDDAYRGSDGNEDILYYLAHVYVDQQKLAQARQAAAELKALEGESFDYHLLMADIASESLQWDQTQDHLEDALALDERAFIVHGFLSYVYFNMDRMQDALVEAQEGVRQFPYSATTFKNLAFAHHALGEIDQAFEAARESLRLDPQYDLGYYILGLCYEDAGDVEKAREAYESFLELYWERANVSHFKEHAQTFLEGLE